MQSFCQPEEKEKMNEEIKTGADWAEALVRASASFPELTIPEEVITDEVFFDFIRALSEMADRNRMAAIAGESLREWANIPTGVIEKKIPCDELSRKVYAFHAVVGVGKMYKKVWCWIDQHVFRYRQNKPEPLRK